MKLFFGAGFGLQHIPSSMGNHYVSTHLMAGIKYKFTGASYLIGSYTLDYGKNTVDETTHSFDGQTISLGLGFTFPKKRMKAKALPKELQNKNQPRKNKQGRPRRQASKPSTYQQTQQLMNELSWPTY